MYPELSIVICTRNRSTSLVRCLAGVAAQRPPFAFETVVVDNGSTDDTRDRLEALTASMPAVRSVYEARPGLSIARNRGAAEARSPLLAYLDDDAEPAPGWLDALRRAFSDTDAALVGGPIVARFEEPVPRELATRVGMVLSCQDLGTERRTVEAPPFLFGANLAVRRADLERVGGFDEALGRKAGALLAFEDTDLCERLLAAGRPLVYEPGAIVFHWIGRDRLNERYLRRRSLDLGRSMGLRLRRERSSGGLAMEVAKKVVKLPAHAALWAVAATVGQEEIAWVAERNTLVTAGLLRELLGARRRKEVVD